MRIAILTPGYSSPGDPWAIPALRNLVDELGKTHDLQVIALRYPFKAGRYRFGPVRVIALGGKSSAGLRRLPLLWRGWLALRAAHEHNPFDVVHGFWADEAGYLAVEAGARLGIPTVVSLMGGELVGYPDLNYGGQLSYFNRVFIKAALKQANLVTVGSHGLAETARAAVPRAQYLVAPLGIDLSHFAAREPRTPTGYPLCILSAASLVPVKDHQNLLHAAALTRSDGLEFSLHLIGDGPLRPGLERLAADLDLAEQIKFHGRVPHPQIPGFFEMADLYLQSSRFESQGMAVLEAAACGSPVAGTTTGILPEIVPSAWTTPIDNPAAMANAIISIIANPADRKKIAAETSTLVREQYGVGKTAGRLIREYGKLV